ncbi:MAG TPA: hypothetical protein VGI92_14010, partial [Gemmatimonadales bacterium]
MIAILLPLLAAAAGPHPTHTVVAHPLTVVDSSRVPAPVDVRLDDRHHHIIVTVGPFKVPATGMEM